MYREESLSSEFSSLLDNATEPVVLLSSSSSSNNSDLSTLLLSSPSSLSDNSLELSLLLLLPNFLVGINSDSLFSITLLFSCGRNDFAILFELTLFKGETSFNEEKFSFILFCKKGPPFIKFGKSFSLLFCDENCLEDSLFVF